MTEKEKEKWVKRVLKRKLDDWEKNKHKRNIGKEFRTFTENERKSINRKVNRILLRYFQKNVIYYNLLILKEYRDSEFREFKKIDKEYKKLNKKLEILETRITYGKDNDQENDKMLYTQIQKDFQKYTEIRNLYRIKLTFLTNNIYLMFYRLHDLGLIPNSIFLKERKFILYIIYKKISLIYSNLFGLYLHLKKKRGNRELNLIDRIKHPRLAELTFHLAFNDNNYIQIISYSQYEVTDRDRLLRKRAIDEIYDYFDSQKERFRLFTYTSSVNMFKRMFNYFTGFLCLYDKEHIQEGSPIDIRVNRVFSEQIKINGENKILRCNCSNFNEYSHFYSSIFKPLLHSLGLLLITSHSGRKKYKKKDKDVDNIKSILGEKNKIIFKPLGSYENITKEGIERVFSLFSMNIGNLDTRYEKVINENENVVINTACDNEDANNEDDVFTSIFTESYTRELEKLKMNMTTANRKEKIRSYIKCLENIDMTTMAKNIFGIDLTKEDIEKVCLYFAFTNKEFFRYCLKGLYLFIASFKSSNKKTLNENINIIRQFLRDNRLYIILDDLIKKHNCEKDELKSLIDDTFKIIDIDDREENRKLLKFRKMLFNALLNTIYGITKINSLNKNKKFIAHRVGHQLFYLSYLQDNIDIFEPFLRILNLDYYKVILVFKKLMPSSDEKFVFSVFRKNNEIKDLINLFSKKQEEYLNESKKYF